MSGRVSEQTPHAPAAVAAAAEPSCNGSAHPTEAAVAVADFPASRYGALGVLAKRIVARLLRPWTVRQQAVDDAQWSALEEIRARFAAWEAATAGRAALTDEDVLTLRRDLSDAALDFGRIADRVRAFENVRRVVERSGPFRRDVRAQRRDIIELRQQLGALSARLTLVQREIAPIRAAGVELREALAAAGVAEIAARREEIQTAVRAESVERREAIHIAVAAQSAALRSEMDAAALAQRTERDARFDDATRAQRAERAAEIEAVTNEQRAERRRELEAAVNALRALLDAADSALRDDFASSLAQFKSVVDGADRLHARLLATPYMAVSLDEWKPSRRSAPGDLDYLGFEAVFRGSEELIRERLRAYLPLVRPRAPVVELGCGRGEFLDLLRTQRIGATGVDINPEAVAHCRALGLEGVTQGDANAYLASLRPGSVGTVFSAQVAEHLSFDELIRNLTCALDVLEPGGLYIAETINPNSIEGGKTFYVDPSHVKPLFPEVFAWLCKSVGFAKVRVFYPNGGGFAEPEPTSQHEYAVVATA